MTKLIYPNFPKEIVKSQDYLDQYIEFINSRLVIEKTKLKTAEHHKIPKSLNGHHTHPDNLIILTHEDHYKAHYLLWKAINGNKMSYVFFMMHNFKKNKYGDGLSAKEYAILREEISKKLSERLKGQTPWNKGFKETEDYRNRINRALEKNGTSYGREGCWSEQRKIQDKITRKENNTQVLGYKYSEESKIKRKQKMNEKGTTDGPKKGSKQSIESRTKRIATMEKNGTSKKGLQWTKEQKERANLKRLKNGGGKGTQKWITNDIISYRIPINESLPTGFRKGRGKLKK